jgi:hypothetical protein
MNEKQEQLNKDFKEAIVKLESHARVSNEEVGKIQVDVSKITTDLEWLKKFFWVVATASIGSLVGVIIGLIIK